MEAEEKCLYACWTKRLPAGAAAATPWNWPTLAMFDWPNAAILATDDLDATAHLNGDFKTDLADALVDTLSMFGVCVWNESGVTYV